MVGFMGIDIGNNPDVRLACCCYSAGCMYHVPRPALRRPIDVSLDDPPPAADGPMVLLLLHVYYWSMGCSISYVSCNS